MEWWKTLGVAAFVGVAATGVLVARSERRFHDYSSEEIRERLHARVEEAFAGHEDFVPPLAAEDDDAAPSAAPDLITSDAPVPATPAGLAGVRHRVATGVSRVRTRLGVRQLPTRRRRRAATTVQPG